jgi:hypothetical protein
LLAKTVDVPQSGFVMKVDVTEKSTTTDLLVVREPSLRITSSAGLGSNVVAVERHRVKRLETALSHPVVYLMSGQQVSYGERLDRRGRFIGLRSAGAQTFKSGSTKCITLLMHSAERLRF